MGEHEDKFERMVEEAWEHKDLWNMAFLAALNTPTSFKAFLRKVGNGTALDWWKTEFLDGVASGDIQARNPRFQEQMERVVERHSADPHDHRERGEGD